MQIWFQDFRYALRQLRKNPGFTSTAIVILGLGIGATTAIFSAVNPILFEPLPYPEAKRIMMIWYAASDGSRIPQTFHTYRELTERNRAFDTIAVMKPWQPTLTGAAQPERLEGQKVSAGYFRTLGVAPALGRDFQASDDVLHGLKVVILGNEVVAFALRCGQHDHWPRDQARRRQLYRHRRDAGRLRQRPGSLGGVLVASAVRQREHRFSTDPRVGPSPADDWAIAARRQQYASQNDLDMIAHAPVPEFPRPAWARWNPGSSQTRSRMTSPVASSRRCSPFSVR